jgi:hypothetical protein
MQMEMIGSVGASDCKFRVQSQGQSIAFVILSELFWLVRLLMISDMNDKRIASQQKVNRSDEAGITKN